MSNNTTRIAGLETRVEALDSKLDRLLALVEGKPAKAKGKGTKAPKVEKGDATVRHLVRKNRPAFVKAHPWAAGMSTAQIAEAVVSGAQTCESGWAIGERRTAMVTGEVATPKAAKKRSTKKATRQVAEVDADAPAKAYEAPRRANGTITPRSEWALRESLAETGQFDRHEIDAIVAAQA